MKKLSWLAVIAVLLLGASCRPQYIFYPVPPIEDEETTGETVSDKAVVIEFLNKFNPAMAWEDSLAGRSDIWQEDIPSGIALIYTRTAYNGIVQRNIQFRNYQQNEDGLFYNGSIMFSFDGNTDTDNDGTAVTIAAGEDFSMTKNETVVEKVAFESFFQNSGLQ